MRTHSGPRVAWYKVVGFGSLFNLGVCTVHCCPPPPPPNFLIAGIRFIVMLMREASIWNQVLYGLTKNCLNVMCVFAEQYLHGFFLTSVTQVFSPEVLWAHHL